VNMQELVDQANDGSEEDYWKYGEGILRDNYDGKLSSRWNGYYSDNKAFEVWYDGPNDSMHLAIRRCNRFRTRIRFPMKEWRKLREAVVGIPAKEAVITNKPLIKLNLEFRRLALVFNRVEWELLRKMVTVADGRPSVCYYQRAINSNRF
jgi:hypothetical protein